MNQVQTSSHALSQSSSAPVIQLDNDYQPTCANNSVPINPGLLPGSSSPGGDNRSHLRSIYHSTMDATTFCTVASTHIVPVPISSVIGCVETPVIRGGGGGSSSSCSSNASVAFQIKRESDPPGSPPVRSPSAHSLPSNCSAPSYFVDISNPVGSHVIDAFCVRKHAFSEEKRAQSTNPPQAPLPTQRLSIEHGPHYNNCESIGNPYPHSHVTSEGGVGSYVSSCSSISGSRNIHSQSPFHPDSSQPPVLFGNQRCSLSSALSTLPLPSQVPGAAILDTNDRCTSTIAPLEINSGTITTAVVQPMDSSPTFYSSETVSSNATWTVINEGNNQVRLYNNNNYLSIMNGNTVLLSMPPGVPVQGVETKFQVVNIGTFVYLESLKERGRHIGILPSGDLKSALATGRDLHAKFGVRLLYSAYAPTTVTTITSKR